MTLILGATLFEIVSKTWTFHHLTIPHPPQMKAIPNNITTQHRHRHISTVRALVEPSGAHFNLYQPSTSNLSSLPPPPLSSFLPTEADPPFLLTNLLPTTSPRHRPGPSLVSQSPPSPEVLGVVLARPLPVTLSSVPCARKLSRSR